MGSSPLAAALGADGDGVIISQVVPHFDDPLLLAAAYRAALRANDPSAQPGFGSLEGYAVGRMLVLALNHIEGEVTRGSVNDALEGLGKFDLGMGVPLELSPKEHQACHQVWPSVLRSGQVVAAGWSELFPQPRAEVK